MNTKAIAVLAFAGAAVLSAAAGGCQKTQSSTEVVMDSEGSMATVASTGDDNLRAGALLWSQNCARCHNLRNPRERSDRQWDIIVHHMRVRGNLTAEEHRLILAFLQASN